MEDITGVFKSDISNDDSYLMKELPENVIALHPTDPRPAVTSVRSKPSSLIKKRCYAFTTDLFLITIINKMIMVAYSNFLKTTFIHLSSHTQNRLIDGLLAVNFSILLLTFWGYFFLSYFLAEGQTPGKLIFNLRVYSKSDSSSLHLSIREGVGRTCGYFLCYIMGMILFAIPILRRDGRGLPDWFSGTFTEQADFQIATPTLQSVVNETDSEIQLSLFSDQQLADVDNRSNAETKHAA
ncbi:MAG: RDD family protein [Bdellovibrionales bacterium]|jgi:uncharacterized RDD family membrane protein YckC|nr:RDD family protein [Bdellovibrionales bacterium]MBT3524927.1 RDD family protein [Bdellovibrionales bacterium]MBT7668131.1 RDD family protein [Bdellovibrionales bacterium]MBT7767448.1 RDD family protein [Bdellovibrionales bacterium]